MRGGGGRGRLRSGRWGERRWLVSIRWVMPTHLSWLWTAYPSGCRLRGR